MIDLDFFENAAQESAGGLSVVVIDEQPELSEVEVEELIDKVRKTNEYIASQRRRYDSFKAYYQMKIAKAEENFEADTKYASKQVEEWTAILRRYAEAHITGKRKSIKFPSGTLELSKNQPKFFIDGQAVTNDNPKLLALARSIDTELVALKETTRWGELKKRLVVDGDTVVLKDTGEVVPELRAYTEPDTFTIKTA